MTPPGRRSIETSAPLENQALTDFGWVNADHTRSIGASIMTSRSIRSVFMAFSSAFGVPIRKWRLADTTEERTCLLAPTLSFHPCSTKRCAYWLLAAQCDVLLFVPGKRRVKLVNRKVRPK